ncbi:MAG: hypothetical protein F4046_02035, partial [Acidimicrobiaceae bacterium]|nr:hypothetical protein [Acidimicrobiaceae bacterium]
RPAADTPTPRPLGTPRQQRNPRRHPRPQLPGTRQPALHPSHSRGHRHLEQRPLRPPIPTTPAQRPMGSRHTRTHLRSRLANPFTATCYHSLIVERASVPPVLEVTATCHEGLVMGLRHRRHPTEGVQFHPESVLTDAGRDLLDNFLARCR